MGMFDTINVFMKCPYCGNFESFDAQTKDLNNALFNYTALYEDWFLCKTGRKFRLGLPVFKQYPFDKENAVWKNQAEHIEAQAKIEDKFCKLKFVEVIASCPSSKRHLSFEGKIKIKKGFLIGEIYDIVKLR
jgi:hypothetical protein